MITAIVGFGKIGNMHAQALNGHSLVVVDPKVSAAEWPSFPATQEIRKELLEKIGLWIIASPTDQHLSCVKAVLSLQPNARILVEKPAVLPDQFDELTDLQLSYPDARLAVQDTYGHSPVTDWLVHTLSAVPRLGRLTDLAIEMSKNRHRDEDLGRFTDREWGVAGYEGFHLVSLRDRLLSLGSETKTRVELITSCDGLITLRPDLLKDAYSPSARRLIECGEIPYGNEFRFRLIQGSFSSGLKFELAYEPLFGGRPGYKNIHCLSWKRGGEGNRLWFAGNHFTMALRTQVDRLRAGRHTLRQQTLRQHVELKSISVRERQNSPRGVL